MCSLEVWVASIGTLLNVFRDVPTELLHPSLDRLAARSDLLCISHIVEAASQPVRR